VNNNYNSNTVVKQDFAAVKQVDGQAAHMTNTTRHQLGRNWWEVWGVTPPKKSQERGPNFPSLGVLDRMLELRNMLNIKECSEKLRSENV
jgi:hypothetical protein